MFKKSEKKIKKLWTKGRNLTIFPLTLCMLAVSLQAVADDSAAGVVNPESDELAAEVKMLKDELCSVQGELIDVLEKYETLKEREEKLNSQLAVKLLGIEGKDSSDALSGRVSALEVVLRLARKQSTEIVEFCKTLSRKLDALKLSDLEKYKIQVELEQVKNSAERNLTFFNGEWTGRSDSAVYDVLAVNNELGIVVLAGGLNSGIRVGQLYKVSDRVMLKIVSVRPYVAAGMLLKGKLVDITPGDKAVRVVTQTKK